MAEPWAPATLPCSRNRFYNARAGAVGLFASKSEQSRCKRTRWAHSHACDARTVALRLNVIILLQHHPIVCGSWTGIVVCNNHCNYNGLWCPKIYRASHANKHGCNLWRFRLSRCICATLYYMTGKQVTSCFDNVNRSWWHQGDIFDKFSPVLEPINRPQLTPRPKWVYKWRQRRWRHSINTGTARRLFRDWK